MSEPLTAKQMLAELILEQPLAEYVAEKRTAIPQWSWRLIAEHLSIDTEGKVDVTHETLRTWYGTEVAA